MDEVFGRDNFIANTSDYSIVTGLRNEIHKSYCSAFGRGHVLKMDDASARGRYSEIDESFRYIDRVGYGTGFEPSQRKNIYTLDTQGNGWFRGDVRVGGDNYDNAETLLTIKEYEAVDELTQNQAVLGDITKVSHTIAAYPYNEYADYNLTLFKVYGDSQFELGTFHDRVSIKIPVRDDAAKFYYAYFNVAELTGTPAANYEMKITYYDNGNTPIRIQYRNQDAKATYVQINRTDTNTWKTKKHSRKGVHT